ncbi:MAG: hypothetical protein EP349_05675, partial [Alphaproteobacteria bacterium]
MQSLFEKMQDKAAEFKQELEDEIEEGKEKFFYTVEEKKVHFQEAALAQQKEWRTGLMKYFFKYAQFRHIITAPFIYALILPLSLLDLFVTIYQAICFTAYGIPKVKRADYVVIDRQTLEYLNLVEKLNCVYCGYANGVLTYAAEIAARTEHFWCPIKHSRLPRKTHDRYHEFLEYGDAENYRDRLLNMRDKCRACKEGDGC